MTPIELTKTEFIQRVGNFEESPKDWKYVGDKPCIVDFHAPWCGYCKRLEPILDEFAKEYDGKLYIYKVNVDNEEELEAALTEIIAETGATSGKDMGKVMGVASKKLAGLAEGRAISAKVKELLG